MSIILPKVGELWKRKHINSGQTYLITKVSDATVWFQFSEKLKNVFDDFEDFECDIQSFLKDFEKLGKMQTPEENAINPSYYQQGKIEVCDFIVDQNLGYLAGCIIKYLCRYKKKNGVEDLKKSKSLFRKIN